MQSHSASDSPVAPVDAPSPFRAVNAKRVPVIHVLDGVLLGKQYLWGKEQVVSNLIHEQQRSVRFAPALAVFSPCLLSERIEADGVQVVVLNSHNSNSPWEGLRNLIKHLRANPSSIVHTHGYKANIVGRIARSLGAPMAGIVSTSHGFDNTTSRLHLYNALDRISSPGSDAVTFPDEAMLAAFPRSAKTKFIANAIPDRPLPGAEERARARKRFGWTDADFVAGAMGRLSESKGIPEFIEAANSTKAPLLWAVAGVGPLQADVEQCNPARVRSLGYVTPSDDFITAIDVYVQASHSEGLSLSLLEAMRAAKPIVATRVNGTKLAIRDGVDGVLLEPRSAQALAQGVERLSADRVFAARLGESARASFLENFRIERQAQAYEELYARVCDARGRTENETS